MPTGRYIDDGAIGSIAIGSLDGAADFVVVHDDSDTANPTKRSPWAAWAARMLHTTDISHLTAMAALSSVDLAADEVLVFDTSTTRFVRVPAEQAIGRILTRANISGLSNFSAISSIDAANDRFILWDASAGSFVTLTASQISNALFGGTPTHYVATPTPVTSAMQTQIVTNYGATLDITYQIADMAAPARLTFQKMAGYEFYVDPYSSELIGEGAAGKYLQLLGYGQVTLQKMVSGRWEIVNQTCDVDYEP